MTEPSDRVRAHNGGPGAIDRIRAALETIAAKRQHLAIAQLGMLDQSHTRRILATAELNSTNALVSESAATVTETPHSGSTVC